MTVPTADTMSVEWICAHRRTDHSGSPWSAVHRPKHMTKKECKSLIIEAGYYPAPALVTAVLTAVKNLVTRELVEREFKKLAKGSTPPPESKPAGLPPKPIGMPPKPTAMPPKPTS